MNVELEITRGDIVWFNISRVFQLRSHLTIFAIAFAFSAYLHRGTTDGAEFLISSLIGAVYGFMAVFVMSMAWVLMQAASEPGVLGRHSYSIEDDGLRVRTDAADVLNYWHSIKSADKSRRAIVLEVSGWSYLTLPRRSFENDAQYDAFFSELELRCQLASNDG